MSVCPSGAISRDSDHDIILVDKIKCITCAMCAMVCPFDVLTFHPLFDSEIKRPVAVKCDLCINRRRKGKVPVCVEACKVDALEFGELNDLVKAARTRFSKEVSVAVGEIKSKMIRAPAHMESWRGWGKKVEKINKR
jgi:carbon-monoxide dehydrogenase iron sulfur subunit